MPTPTKGPRLGSGPAHQRLMLANLATSLFEHGRITTTEAKAKRLRPLAERLISFAKRGDLHARRQVLATIHDKDVVHQLFAEIGPRYAERPGGYTRITKVGARKGDNAPLAVIELVEALTVGQEAVKEGERARGTRFANRPAAGGDGTSGGDEPPEVEDTAKAEADADTDEADVDEAADDADSDDDVEEAEAEAGATAESDADDADDAESDGDAKK